MKHIERNLTFSLVSVIMAIGLLAGMPTAAHAQTYVNVNTFYGLQSAIYNYNTTAVDTVITVTANFDIPMGSYISPHASVATLTIKGVHPGIAITRDVCYNNLFFLSSNANLILEDIIVDGNKGACPNGSSSLVYVAGGEFTMKAGAVLMNNSNTGVEIEDGIFNMLDGEISGNTSFAGGGVNISGGEFIMHDGEIRDNSAFWGGGVYITYTFDGFGSGEYISGGTFVMLGGKIINNIASWGYGGGVYSSDKFAMLGGEISGNSADSGGGVFVELYKESGFGEFITGGTAVISDNTNNNAYIYGGGYITLSTETPPVSGMIIGVQTEMKDGVIVESDANPGDESYFFADEPGKGVIYDAGQLIITNEPPDLRITGYTIVSGTSLGAFCYEFLATADVTNFGSAAYDVSGWLVEWPSNTIVIKGDLYFGDVAANATVTSTDIFKIRVNLSSTPSDGKQLAFDLYYSDQK